MVEISEQSMPMSCVLCHSRSFTFVLQGSDLRLPLSGEFELFQCTNCGLVALQPQPTPTLLAAHYAAQLWQVTSTQAETTRAKFAPTVELLKRRCLQRGRLLDVGCGPGDFVEIVACEGWEAYGIEVDAAQVDYARRQGRNVSLWADFTTYPVEPKFDVITFNHVLEHVRNPIDYLRKAASLLNPDGILLASVPNFAGITRRIFGRYWMHLDLPRHLFHFSPDTMARALTVAGFQVDELAFVDLVQDSLGIRNSLRRWLVGQLPRRWRQLPDTDSLPMAEMSSSSRTSTLLRTVTDLLARAAEQRHCADTFTAVAILPKGHP